MSPIVLRSRILMAKAMRRLRRVMNNFTQPSDVEKLMASLPKIEAGSELHGAVVLVTGSSRGVGRAIAETLSAEGAKVVLHARDLAHARNAADEIRQKTGNQPFAVAGDLSGSGAGRKVVADAIVAAGRLDILINNAGTTGPTDRPLWMVDSETIEKAVNTNFGAVLEASSAAISYWLENGIAGRVVNISTGAVEAKLAKMGTYGMTKAALESLGAHMAADLDRCGIAVTTVRLGSVKTDLTKSVFAWEEAETLPPPESVIPVILHAATAPWDAVTGRTFSSWTFNADAISGKAMAHRAAAAPVFRYPDLRLGGESVPRESDRITVYDRAENHFGAAPQVKEALLNVIEQRPLAIYPDDDYRQLTSALSAYWNLPKDHFTIGAGSWSVLDRILKLYCEPGDGVVVNDPGWFGFGMLCNQRGLQQIRIPFQPGGGPNNRPHHNLDGVLDGITHRTKLIYLITPSNPEGVTIDRQEFSVFLSRVPPHIPVIIDEAYAEFAVNPDRLIGPEVVRNTDHPVIVTRTFSKFHGLASLRIGYGVAKPDIVERLDRMSITFGVSKLAEVAAIASLGAKDYHAQLLETFSAERTRITDELRGMVLAPIASDSCTLLVLCPCKLETYFETFEKQGIFVVRGAFFDGKYIIFPIGRNEQNNRNLEIMRSLL